MQIVIYTFEVTNRLNYVLDFIFVQYFGLDYYLETDIVIFKKKTLSSLESDKISNATSMIWLLTLISIALMVLGLGFSRGII